MNRTPIHRRRIEVDAYLREDGCWDIEGHLKDVRNDDLALPSGEIRTAGQPVHEMRLSWVVDKDFVIVDARAEMPSVPFPTTCDAIAEAYGALRGLSLSQGFNQAVRESFGRVKGCTHVNHLIGAMAAAAFQSVGRPPGSPARLSNRVIDQCHALSGSGEVVRLFRSRAP